MNKYLRSFLHRGLLFGGFGPIIASSVYMSINLSGIDLMLDGVDIFIGTVSTYLLAFIQAGASVFNQIESWPIARSLLCHLGSIYLAYVGTYLVNSWIPFEPFVLLIFTAVFTVTYFAIWLTVFFITRAVTKKMNESISELDSGEKTSA